ncbi:tetratricopeptide repeat protein [Pseudochrobactrum sp. Wa41.01b-1]|uniref:tetratricopeptide repeat protein n=1 Tax=unclassified Pseudochrobactrum TaxID=2647013 RepID=UPI0003A6950B|nr:MULTISPECIES: tetratricopeptide repeat protein [unclassified Pseudochrobactrum]MBX8784917.1 tetratricopeptide repeat protein [Ochrobactrum sp. GRS2]QYM72611.1 tetratricopeptide repeat protein [Pseudochrobactrum sp. Wa41.01b-1]UCA46324.1 tetratricopeptide repeat protein [Pseudochrobactrum sp. XF203]
MTDDSFIREVNEELRSEQVRAVWRRFGPVLIGGAVAVVIGTAGYVGYEYWRESKAAVSGDQFLTALDLAGEKKTDEALSALKKLETEGAGSYPVLAQLRTATLLEQKKDMAGAVTAFDAVAADSKAPVALRDVAKLRAAYILVDTGSYEDVAKRAETLSADGNPMRGSAREVLGLAAYKAGRADDARKLFQQNADDAAIPANLRQRANTMLDLMRSSETAAKG